jgi:hypothetical protein
MTYINNYDQVTLSIHTGSLIFVYLHGICMLFILDGTPYVPGKDTFYMNMKQIDNNNNKNNTNFIVQLHTYNGLDKCTHKHY